MHTKLQQQLKKLKIDSDVTIIELNTFNKLIKLVSKTYKKQETREDKLKSDTRLIHTVFQEATEGIIIEDKNRNIIQANASMARILGTNPNELIGKHSDYLSL